MPGAERLMALSNKGIVLERKPKAFPNKDDFKLVDWPLRTPKAGEVTIKHEWLSLDPYMRGQISGRHSHGAVAPGELMLGECVGRVIESHSERYKAGDLVRAMSGWQHYATLNEDALTALPRQISVPSHALSILGMPGLTAYAGLMWNADPKPGETLLVGSASGAVGSMVVQLAKRAGCRVVAVAGSDEKCQFVREVLGADICINRKTEVLADAIPEYCPQGIDIYFDLVGGQLLDIASNNLALSARVILCGMSSQYNRVSDARPTGPSPANWIVARARVQGLVVYDFEARREEFIQTCAPWLAAGELVVKEAIYHGLSSAPQAFVDLMRGKVFGKAVVKM